MSKFSGKCDFYDMIQMCEGVDGLKSRYANVYVGYGDGQIKLDLDDHASLVQYYPHIISASASSENDDGVIYLTAKSWVDIEEERYGHLKMHDYYRERLQQEMEKYNTEE